MDQGLQRDDATAVSEESEGQNPDHAARGSVRKVPVNVPYSNFIHPAGPINWLNSFSMLKLSEMRAVS
jgi:hypothetical protein